MNIVEEYKKSTFAKNLAGRYGVCGS